MKKMNMKKISFSLALSAASASALMPLHTLANTNTFTAPQDLIRVYSPITPFATADFTTLSDGFNEGMKTIPFGTSIGLYYDLGSYITILEYTGDVGAADLEYTVYTQDGAVYSGLEDVPINAGGTISFTGYPDGEYVVRFLNINGPATDTGFFIINILTVTATVDITGPHGIYNPDELSVGSNKDDAELYWEIKEGDTLLYTSEDGKTLEEILAELKEKQKETGGESTYTLTNTADVQTKFGHHVDDTVSKDFILRYPKTTTTVDKPENPDSITGTQTIDDSELTWEITDKDGNVVLTGDGPNVPKDEIDSLPPGEYEVSFTETSPEGETHTSTGSFKIPKETESTEDTQGPTEATEPTEPTGPSDTSDTKDSGTTDSSDSDDTGSSSSQGSGSNNNTSGNKNNSKGSTTSKGGSNSRNPRTGDSTPFLMASSVMIGLSTLVFAFISVLKRKKAQ